MRVGCYTGIGLLLTSILFASYSYSNPIIFAGARLLPRIIGSTIAKRAATKEIAVKTGQVIEGEVLKKTVTDTVLTKSPLFRNTAGMATWLGLGYSISDALNPSDAEYKDYNQKNIPAIPESELPKNIEYVKQQYIRNRDVENQLFCLENDCVFSELSNIHFVRIAGSSVRGVGNYTVTDSKGKTINREFSASLYVNVDYVFDRYSTMPKINEKHKNDYENRLKQIIVPDEQLSKFINDLLMKAATQENYKGIPISATNAVTASEIKELLKGQNITYYDLTQTFYNENKIPQVVVLPETITPPDTGTDGKVDLGENPNTPSPEIEKPPTGEEILKPLTELMPDVKNLNIAAKDVQCPKWEFELWEKKYSFDSHCTLLEKIRPVLKAVFLLIWGIVSLRIILSA